MIKKEIDYRLYLVTDRSLIEPRPLEDVVMEAVRGGVTLVQLREKEESSSKLVREARKLKSLLEPRNVALIINDYPEVALRCGADGVHLGQSDMAPEEVRRLLGEEAIIGLSVETIEQAAKAESQPVDYLGVSPVFTTSTKRDTGTPWGVEGLRKLRQRSSYPLVAIGGINADNVQSVVNAGADGVAVVSAICSAPNPRMASKKLRQQIDKAKSQILQH